MRHPAAQRGFGIASKLGIDVRSWSFFRRDFDESGDDLSDSAVGEVMCLLHRGLEFRVSDGAVRNWEKKGDVIIERIHDLQQEMQSSEVLCAIHWALWQILSDRSESLVEYLIEPLVERQSRQADSCYEFNKAAVFLMHYRGEGGSADARRRMKAVYKTRSAAKAHAMSLLEGWIASGKDLTRLRRWDFAFWDENHACDVGMIHLISYLLMTLAVVGDSDSCYSIYEAVKADDCFGFFHAARAFEMLTKVELKLLIGLTPMRPDLVMDASNRLARLSPAHPMVAEARRQVSMFERQQTLATNSVEWAKVSSFSGSQFEEFLLDRFISLGFRAEGVGGAGDFGADLLLTTANGTRIVVQAKRHRQKVNLKAVQEVHGACEYYKADMGIVITTSGYFPSAKELACASSVELWSELEMLKFLVGDLSFSEINSEC